MFPYTLSLKTRPMKPNLYWFKICIIYKDDVSNNLKMDR